MGSLCVQRKLKIEDFNYNLPDSKIALHPLSHRDDSKLLVCRGKELLESRFKMLPTFLPQNTLLFFNDTRVVQARLVFYKPGNGSRIEIFCLEPWDPSDIAVAFARKQSCSFKCLIGNNKKWKDGVLLAEFVADGKKSELYAERVKSIGDAFVVKFSWKPLELSFAEVLEQVGKVPLPPYIHRGVEEEDKERYQTVFAHYDGSVAAPTAGLHFTPDLLDCLAEKGVKKEFLTLHVGAGTFKPVKSEEIGDHSMHEEHISVSKSSLQTLLVALREKNCIVPVGTTSMRSLESLYWFGVKILSGELGSTQAKFKITQWEPYETFENTTITAEESLEALIDFLEKNSLNSVEGITSLMIAPGYTFAFCKGIITNFHQPKSTLLLLVSALIGDNWKRAYDYALLHDFRFLSYGDSCLFLP
ncbi:MAG: S-adenosylmethionine:tRNA ribosyltransferase-isomerase [Bacteroidales bacterium]